MNFELGEAQVAVRELAAKLVGADDGAGRVGSEGVAGRAGAKDSVGSADGAGRSGPEDGAGSAGLGNGARQAGSKEGAGQAGTGDRAGQVGSEGSGGRAGATDRAGRAELEDGAGRTGSDSGTGRVGPEDGSGWGGLWRRLGEAELLSLAVPERLGGSGLGVLETAALLTELGRGGVVSPGLAHLALGVLPVARLGTGAQQDQLLAGGGLTAAVGRTDVEWGARGLTGVAVGVPFAEWARWVLVVVSLAGGGRGVAVVDPRGAGVELVSTPTSSGAAECTVRLAGAEPVGLLGDDGSGRVAEELWQCAVVGACAFGEGLLAGALGLTVAHVGQRRQFGRVLAEFQAVAMQVADVRIAARTVELVTRAACWKLGEGLAARADVAVAGYWVGEGLPGALETCHHLHGGLGLDVGYPLHRFSALGRDLVRFLGALRAY